MMNAFDKFCAGVAALLAVVLLLLGMLGLFAGCRASFTLPPILGVLPAFAGWGILKSVMVAWQVPPHRSSEARHSSPPTTSPDNPFAT